MRSDRPVTRSRGQRAVSVLAVALSAAGCGRPAGVIFDPAAGALVWPSPPETPRIRYVGQIAGDDDLKPGRSPGKALGAALFGKGPSHAMLSPMGVCTDGASRVFVADSNAQLVHVFDLDTRAYAQWKPPNGQPVFTQPVALAWDAGGRRLLVCDSVGGMIHLFDHAGVTLGTWGYGRLKRPCGIAVDAPRSRVLVADAAAHEVVVFLMDGSEAARFGGRGEAPGRFNFPTQVAVDGAGLVYISDTLNFRVQVMTREFAPLRQIGRKGDVPGTFSQPKGIALDADGHLYVVDAHFEAVQVFDSAGALLLSFGREGRGPGEFWLPAGIHIDATGRLWIADSYNKRVQVFQYLRSAEGPPP